MLQRSAARCAEDNDASRNSTWAQHCRVDESLVAGAADNGNMPKLSHCAANNGDGSAAVESEN
jgi:hypothetical protein